MDRKKKTNDRLQISSHRIKKKSTIDYINRFYLEEWDVLRAHLLFDVPDAVCEG